MHIISSVVKLEIEFNPVVTDYFYHYLSVSTGLQIQFFLFQEKKENYYNLIR